jgi:hypothetical protein
MMGALLNTARLDRILRLLDQERRIILNGPLSDLKAVVDRRETALAAVVTEDASLPEAFVRTLRAKAERNSRLLLASLAGLRAAEEQLERIRQTAEQLRAYTAEGTSVELGTPPATREQRT